MCKECPILPSYCFSRYYFSETPIYLIFYYAYRSLYYLKRDSFCKIVSNVMYFFFIKNKKKIELKLKLILFDTYQYLYGDSLRCYNNWTVVRILSMMDTKIDFINTNTKISGHTSYLGYSSLFIGPDIDDGCIGFIIKTINRFFW